MLGFLSKLLGGNKSEKDVKKITPIVHKINEYYQQYQTLTHDELREKTVQFRGRIKNHLTEIDGIISQKQTEANALGLEDVQAKDAIYKEIDELKKERNKKIEEILQEIHPEAFAVVKEAARRLTHNKTLEVTATEHDRNLAVTKQHITIQGDKAIYQNTWNAAGTTVTWNMVHYDVQLIGGSVLHEGKIAEMATGEGKTLVSTLPAYLNALPSEGVHIVTVNDYLAKRDSEWNGPLFEFLGLTVDCIDKHTPNSEARRSAYLADITYGTNNEFGFDYLRDNMVHNPSEMVQRKHHFAMVDEVDSVLIDDARTPLIISGPVGHSDNTQQFFDLKPRIEKLVDAQKRAVNQFLNEAKKKIAEGNDDPKDGGLALFRAHRGLPKNTALIKFLSEPGNRVKLQKAENFYLADQQKEMPKADEELYFYIEEKSNSVELTDKGIQLITRQGEDPNFFVIPDIAVDLASIDQNTQLEPAEKLQAKESLLNEYAVKADRIHTVQQLLKSYTLFEKDVEYVVMDGAVKIVDEQTGRILDGRRYSDGLHQALEAKENVKIEASTQTYATITLQNYFRMYHKLCGMTGTAETEAAELWDIYKLDVVSIPTNVAVTRIDAQDLIYKTKREKFGAVIAEIQELVFPYSHFECEYEKDKEGNLKKDTNGHPIPKLNDVGKKTAVYDSKGALIPAVNPATNALEPKTPRPVLVGTTSVEISELLSRMLRQKGIAHNVLNAKQHTREAQIVAEAGLPGAVTIATNMAGRGTDIKLGAGVKEAGGLAILGTERHESRRVDRQLRGRAGRQGDPGSSQFFVSLEDDLMRMFGSERIAKVMDMAGYKEGEVIQHSMITKSIERAQRKVEENNFGIRKRLLEYDDVMNKQRTVIYTKRNHALFGDRLALDIDNAFYDVAEALVSNYKEAGDYQQFVLETIINFGIETPFTEEEFAKSNETSLVEKLHAAAYANYQKRKQQIAIDAVPVFKNIQTQQGSHIENVIVPFTDGKRGMQVLANMQKTLDTNGTELVNALERNITLALIDDAWKEHLRSMDDLKQSVQTASYEQKDPLVIYKSEAFLLFKQMSATVNKSITNFLCHAEIPMEQDEPPQIQEAYEEKTDLSGLSTGRDFSSSDEQNYYDPQPEKQQPIVAAPKIGRNDPCPCGSGKKYKQCHGG
ncbi:MAG: preprotein translocase subunit SecA [Bacteroidetes bacterium]|nr:MAG: preprotein translocase subunit SecA [Bacteroidota bacterium]